MNRITDPWEPVYDRMAEEVCRNEKERAAAKKLREGASLCESRIAGGLSREEFDDLYQRLKHWEDTKMTSGISYSE